MFTVPVRGGQLAACSWGEGPPDCLAIHGASMSHRSWAGVARQSHGKSRVGSLIALDLRGRGRSVGKLRKRRLAQYADDCAAVLRSVCSTAATGPVTVAGHSSGGFVALVLAHRHPELVRRLVLVDGGPPRPKPADFEASANPENITSPAAKRLSMRFADHEAYRQYWHDHPAITSWNEVIEDFVDYDLVPAEDGGYRSSVSWDAIRGDAEDIFLGKDLPAAWANLKHPAILVRAERGMLNQATPYYPDISAVETRIPVVTVPSSNHYSIVLEPEPAGVVASYLEPHRDTVHANPVDGKGSRQ
ncbi:alpha/beta fold hydrolase [Amycolatopsis magusensis]|nr:alpha/beta hydrolase [Amycolatopsis magusensis]